VKFLAGNVAVIYLIVSSFVNCKLEGIVRDPAATSSTT